MPLLVHERVQRFRNRRKRKIYISLIAGSVLLFFAGRFYFSQAESLTSKQYVLTIDGADFSLRCDDDSVGVCLHKENLVVYERDFLHPDMTAPLEDGMHVIIRRAIPLKLINILGEQSSVYSHGTTVRDFLGESQITLTADQMVKPALDTWLEPDMTIQIFAQREESLKRTIDIPFTTKEKKDNTLMLGKKVIEQKGVIGKKEEEYQLIYIGDKLKEKNLLRSSVITEPQTEIVLVGTKMPDHTQTIEEGRASFYSASLDGSRTASGGAIHLSDLVAAHKTLPFGSLVKVTNEANGKSVVVKIVDRGPYIAGRVIDLTPAAFGQIASLSSGVVSVRLDLIVD